MVAGVLAEIVGWWLVSHAGAHVWRLMPVVLGTMGLAAVLARPPVAAVDEVTVADGAGRRPGQPAWRSSWAPGSSSGLAAHWEPFRRDVVEKYAEAAEVSLARSLRPVAGRSWSRRRSCSGGGCSRAGSQCSMAGGAAAVAAWVGYVGANLASRYLPIVAGAWSAGALWAGLAWWSGGVLASLASHILWTGLMLALPPGAGRPSSVPFRRDRREVRHA